MQHFSLRIRLLLPAFILSLVLPSVVLLPGRALAQSTPDQQLKTKYFTIYYPAGEQDTAAWYAGFADDVDAAVSEMLGQPAVTGVSLSIYDTEADYITANPAAASEPGIMAHSVPEKKEVGVAVERLRQVDPEVARESFRHEMTHVVAGALSNQNLPIGFQEAFAQYNELSTSRAQGSADVLRSAVAANTALASWTDLNDRTSFMTNPVLTYPESYSVMAFLASQYGMGDFDRFMSNLRGGAAWPQALQSAYGKSVDDLQQEWQSYLPNFLNGGWQQNLLAAYDLSPGLALYDAGHFKEAADDFSQSQKLYSDLGRTERAAEAAGDLAEAQQADGASTLASGARKSLEAYDYRTAHDKAAQAVQTFTSLSLKDQQDAARQTLNLAQSGLDATIALQSAQDELSGFNLIAARSDARFASQTFSKLGDTAHAQQANQLVQNLSSAYVVTGLIATVAGALILLAGTLVIIRTRRKRKVAQLEPNGIPAREENVSWL